jgi:hypothetical protein
MWTRRDFLKTLGLFGGVLFTPLRWFIIRSDHSKYLYNYEGSGTLYGGFLLLPEGESPPEFVQYPKPGIPNLCNVGGNREITGAVETFTNISEVTLGLVPGCCADCYGGLHTHIARDSQGESQSFSCYATLYGGSTWFYRWYWNDGWC